MSTSRGHVVATKTKGRAKVSNGLGLLHGADRRAPMSRRYKDLVLAYVKEFRIESEAEVLLVEQAAGLKLALEDRTAAMCRGERVDGQEYGRLSLEHRKILDQLKRAQSARADGEAAHAVDARLPNLSSVLIGNDEEDDDS